MKFARKISGCLLIIIGCWLSWFGVQYGVRGVRTYVGIGVIGVGVGLLLARSKRTAVRGVLGALLSFLVLFSVIRIQAERSQVVAVGDQSFDLVRYDIDSTVIGRQLPQTIVKTRGALPDTLVVFLHGFGGNNNSALDPALFKALSESENAKLAIVFPYSSRQSFWHDRHAAEHMFDNGDWEKYVLSEVIPEAQKRIGVEHPKLLIAGISMGGYGALHIAEQNPTLFCAVAGHSAAIWPSSGDAASGSFDNAEDFNKNNVLENISALKGKPVWLDNGDKDWFLDGAQLFTDKASQNGIHVTKNLWPGGHDQAYWFSHWDDYINFYATVSKSCTIK